jgi:uncharacterized protein YecT (DUF1311 family)
MSINFSTKLLVLSAVLFFSTAAFAKENPVDSAKLCIKNNNSIPAQSRCLDTIIDHIDREMQMWVNNQTFILEELAVKAGRSSALSMFKRAQNNFVKYQEDNCRWQYLAISPDQRAPLAYKKCYILLAVNRIKELQQAEK